ncbi:(2Fe-2S)-binding protein [Rudaea sp.]|uniref:(2Fe-2S)-binding protein n=1 Tax=Rudaea sp. TaxID=2136325 RepID=UPI002ED3A5A7
MQTTPTHPAKPPAAPTTVKTDDEKAVAVRINGRTYSFDGDDTMPLLWYLRDVLRLTGTKFGCGIGACGACTVLVDGKAQRACLTPMKALAKREVTTIEGLANGELHPLQQAWVEIDVPQCGYCQAGQIIAAADLLKRTPNPNDDDIGKISNLCRCGTYPRIRKAIKRAAEITRERAAHEGGKS